MQIVLYNYCGNCTVQIVHQVDSTVPFTHVQFHQCLSGRGKVPDDLERLHNFGERIFSLELTII